ncbi:DUF6886 family protein [Phenylobacterium sp.]|uniref:DUF6886 family protein n=1 Tax=Phenylobacterium sp. TaxID=1871053 RepID=UPI003BAD3180
MRLFHFSDDPGIECFVPRPVRVPSARPPGRDWLNGPLVWAIDETTQPLYFFPRDCPRILLWETPATTPADRQRWFGASAARMIAHVEWAWLERLKRETLYRYELPSETFEDLADAGMWVSRRAVTPLAVETLTDLPAMMAAHGVELRLVESLVPLRPVWSSSLHASGVRLRHAQGWAATGERPAR